MRGRTAAAAPRPIALVVGARPNFVKAAALWQAFRRHRIPVVLVHTGQHYDASLSEVFLRELGLAASCDRLHVGAARPAEQTGRMVEAIARWLRRRRPPLVVVVGDVNSTLAAALAARYSGVPVAHVEAGLRSFDPAMPEELNRRLTDAMAAYLFTPSREAGRNLRREGIPARRIYFVGNVMVDTLRAQAKAAAASLILRRLRLEARRYAVLTLHRPASVDDAATLAGVIGAIAAISRQLPVVFPVHPRTRARLAHLPRAARAALAAAVRAQRVCLLPPVGYTDFQRLVRDARLVLTDSGGLQEETAVLGVPCLTLRRNTERPITLVRGTNRLVGTDPARILRAVRAVLAAPARPRPRRLERWDGRAADRIAAVVARVLRNGRARHA